MPITVRGKFRCTEEVKSAWLGEAARKVVFEAVYDLEIPEDRRFYKATPTGRLEMTVDNPTLFEVGQHYYLDFTPVSTDTDQAVAASAS